jgi:thioredoxin 1
VDFWAPWCGYCRRIGPAVDALAAEYAGKVGVGKVNVDEQPELAEQFKVMTIPSLFVFQNGEHGEAIIAPGSKAQIEEFITGRMNDGVLEVSEATVESEEDFEKLILAYDHSIRRKSMFQAVPVQSEPDGLEMIDNGRYRYPKLIFIRRGK